MRIFILLVAVFFSTLVYAARIPGDEKRSQQGAAHVIMVPSAWALVVDSIRPRGWN
jgi:hypothetical protein